MAANEMFWQLGSNILEGPVCKIFKETQFFKEAFILPYTKNPYKNIIFIALSLCSFIFLYLLAVC